MTKAITIAPELLLKVKGHQLKKKVMIMFPYNLVSTRNAEADIWIAQRIQRRFRKNYHMDFDIVMKSTSYNRNSIGRTKLMYKV